MIRLIEFLDKEPVNNVLMTLMLRPDEVYFFQEKKLNQKRLITGIDGVLKKYLPKLTIHHISMDLDDLDAVTKELEKLSGEGTYLELSGGRDIALIYAGHLCMEREWNCLYVDRMNRQVLKLSGCKKRKMSFVFPDLTIADVVEMTGASIQGTMHHSPDLEDPEVVRAIKEGYRIMCSDYRRWARFLNFLTKAMSIYPLREDCSIEVPAVLNQGNNRNLSFEQKESLSSNAFICEEGMLVRFRKAGILHYERTKKGFLIRFPNRKIKGLFHDTGGWLENYTLLEVKESGAFQDYSMSVTIDWDGAIVDFRSASCEIDLLLVRGIVPVFISCKIGQFSKDALYEIRLMADKFGGKLAKAVLVTGYDITERNLDLYKKANELNISVIVASPGMEGKIGEELERICKI